MRKITKFILMTSAAVVVILPLAAISAYNLVFRPPEIIRGLSPHADEAEPVFEKRVQEQLGGLSLSTLLDALEHQAIGIHHEHSYAMFERAGFSCLTFRRILWSSNGQHVEELQAFQGPACL